jgi:hypothetical protein
MSIIWIVIHKYFRYLLEEYKWLFYNLWEAENLDNYLPKRIKVGGWAVSVVYIKDSYKKVDGQTIYRPRGE